MISEYYKLAINTMTKWRQDRKKKGKEINNKLNEFVIKKKNKSQTVVQTIHVPDAIQGSILGVWLTNSGSNHKVQTARVLDFEERNSRITKSKIEIVTRDITQRNRSRTTVQQELSNFILPFRKSKLNQLDLGQNGKSPISPKNSITKTQAKFNQRSHNRSPTVLSSTGLSPTGRPQHETTHVKTPPPLSPSAMKSPTLLIGHAQPSTLHRDSPVQAVLSLPIQNTVEYIQDSSRSPQTHKKASSPGSPEILGFDPWDSKNFRGSPNSRRDSVKINLQDEIDEMRSAGLSPAGAHFYKRVTAFNLPLTFKKERFPVIDQPTSIEVKALKTSVNLGLISPRKASFGDRPFTVASNTARLTPTSPNAQSPVNLKKVYLFNRGQEIPKAVVVNSETTGVIKFQRSGKSGTPQNRLG